jgi:hypothetical protein
MKQLVTGLIGGVFLAGLLFGTAAASGDDYYEYGGHYEHGRYYNPYYYGNGNVRLYGNGYYNNGYRNHEAYEYNNRYRYQPVIPNGYINPYYNNSNVRLYGNGYYNNGYRNHEAYEYGYRR